MAGAAIVPFYTLAKQAEEGLSADVWRWKLHAIRKSRRALTQVIPMPSTPHLNLTSLYSSADKWDAVFKSMEEKSELVDSIWLLVQERVQQHRLLRMTIREDFLEQLVRHCADSARELAEKESKINIEAKRVEMRDIQIQMQDRAFEEIAQRLRAIPLGDNEPESQLSSDLLSACLQGVRRHVKISRQLKEDRERLLAEVAHKENAQNELKQQVAALETMITEMELKEKALSQQLFLTQDEHKKDVTKLITHIEGLIENNKKLVNDNLHDREEHKRDMATARERHKQEMTELMETLTVMQGMGLSRVSSQNSMSADDVTGGVTAECDIDALRDSILKM